jgi:hypothetical protein
VSLDALRTTEIRYGPCPGPIGVVQFASLNIVPTAEMEPWVSLARWELEVDGVVWGRADYGQVSPAALDAGPPPYSLRSMLVQCDGHPYSVRRYGAGTRQVRVLAHIAGVDASIPSNTLPIDFQCPVPDAGVEVLYVQGYACSAGGAPGVGLVVVGALVSGLRRRTRRGRGYASPKAGFQV